MNSAIVLFPVLFLIYLWIGWVVWKLERIASALEEIAKRMPKGD